MKMGLSKVEHWTGKAGKEWVGDSWENLSHIRQAVTFLVIHQKAKKNIKEIMNDLCPNLSVQQLYRISTMYWDDRYQTETVSHEVLAEMKKMMIGENQHGSSHQFLLDDVTSTPFTLEDIGSLYDGIGMLDGIEIPKPLQPDDGNGNIFAFLGRTLDPSNQILN